MSLDKFINISVDNTIPSIFIHVIGGHGTGKSAIVGKIKQKYKNKICVLGNYSRSKTSNGLLTGGMDGVRMTNQERFSYIKRFFLSNTKAIICEGMITNYYSSFFEKYYKLQETRNRTIYVILLYADIETLCSRILKRSEGKEITEKRLKNIIGKVGCSEKTYEKIEEKENYKKIRFDVSDTKNFDVVLNYLFKIIDEVL